MNWNDIEKIKNIIKNKFNKTDVLEELGLKNNGGNYNTLTRFINLHFIDTLHFQPKKSTKSIYFSSTKIDLELILVKNSSYSNRTKLKERLYKEGLKTRECELCGQGEEWKSKKMSLILDHINGVNNDNRLENLRIVCPNCNATLDTHCRGYTSKKIDDSKILINENINNTAKLNLYIKIDKRKNKRKINRPPYEILKEEIKNSGYCATGRKYVVSDNSIRKWIRMYEKYGKDW